MKLSDIRKEKACNRGVVCSGNKVCYECKHTKKSNKKIFSKGARRIQKKYTRDLVTEVVWYWWKIHSIMKVMSHCQKKKKN